MTLAYESDDVSRLDWRSWLRHSRSDCDHRGYRHSFRNLRRPCFVKRLIFLLSAKAELRAKEIAKLKWWMTNNSEGR